jgi:hypothetical protein
MARLALRDDTRDVPIINGPMPQWPDDTTCDRREGVDRVASVLDS